MWQSLSPWSSPELLCGSLWTCQLRAELIHEWSHVGGQGGLSIPLPVPPSHCDLRHRHWWDPSVLLKSGGICSSPGPACAFYCPSHISTTLRFCQRLLLICSPSFSWSDSDLSPPWQNQGCFNPCSSRSFTGSQPFAWLCLQTGDTRDSFKNHTIDKMHYSDSDRHRKAEVCC